MKDKKYFIYTIISTLLIIFSVLIASYKTHLNRERYARFQEHKQKLDLCVALGEEVSRSITIAFQQGMQIDNFKKKFGELIPVESENDNKSMEQKYTYYHPQSQRTFNLRFKDGALRGINSRYGYDNIKTAVIFDSPEYLLSEKIRHLIIKVSFISWVAVLIVILFRHQQKSILSQSLLILASICFICWFLAGHYSQTLRGMKSNDYLAYGVFMLIVSLGILAVKNISAESRLST